MYEDLLELLCQKLNFCLTINSVIQDFFSLEVIYILQIVSSDVTVAFYESLTVIDSVVLYNSIEVKHGPQMAGNMTTVKAMLLHYLQDVSNRNSLQTTSLDQHEVKATSYSVLPEFYFALFIRLCCQYKYSRHKQICLSSFFISKRI